MCVHDRRSISDPNLRYTHIQGAVLQRLHSAPPLVANTTDAAAAAAPAPGPSAEAAAVAAELRAIKGRLARLEACCGVGGGGGRRYVLIVDHPGRKGWAGLIFPTTHIPIQGAGSHGGDRGGAARRGWGR